MLFRALVAGHLRAGPLRAGVTILAVALGVAIALAIDLANATAIASFARSVNVVSNEVNLQVVGIGRGFDERTLQRVAAIPGVSSASPGIEGSLTVGARAGRPLSGEILQVQGVDLLRPLPRDAGQAPSQLSGATENASDLDLLVNGHGAIVSSRVAGRYGLREGTVLRALVGDRAVALTVARVLPPAVVGIDSSVVFVDVATAQEIFGKIGLLDRIDCVVPSERLPGVMQAVRRVLPAGTRAIEPKVRTGEIARMLSSFTLNLTALSAIALVVGMYLIFNTVAIGVVQRRADIGIVRALGATKRSIFTTFVAEGALFGAIGSAAGLGLGALLAGLSVASVARTVNTLYVATGVDRVLYDPTAFVKAFAVGIVLSLVAALVPAWEAARTPPAQTMRSGGFESPIPHFGVKAALAGCLVLLCAWLASKGPPLAGVPMLGYVSGILIIVGGSLCIPILIEGVSAFGRRFAPAAPAELAAANLGAALRRNSVAVAALAIAVGMMTSVAILVGSFRTTVVAWANDTLRADLFVHPLGAGDDTRFSPGVGTTIARLPGVTSINTFVGITIPFRGRLTTLGATSFVGVERNGNLRFLEAGDRERVGGWRDTTEALVSEPFATRFGVEGGDTIEVPTPSGPTALHVAATYYDYSSDAGVILIDRATFARLFDDDSVEAIAVYARAGTDLPGLRSEIVRRLTPLRIGVQTNRELRALVIAIFDRTFAITYALYAISLAIALLGVVSTLFALVLERRTQIGILRYLGLTTGRVRAMILIEAALVGGLGALAGTAIGALLALLLIFVINRQAFGWLIELHVPGGSLLSTFAIVVLAAVVAGWYPAQVAARIQTAAAVRAE
ncbi:MAG: FtsX-like permease family protein [Candidatus Eremiobacteraeota bacterium]|nr:FtsX-like permease family protein [Candidatus Eremiobacteraeota bacterium]